MARSAREGAAAVPGLGCRSAPFYRRTLNGVPAAMNRYVCRPARLRGQPEAFGCLAPKRGRAVAAQVAVERARQPWTPPGRCRSGTWPELAHQVGANCADSISGIVPASRTRRPARPRRDRRSVSCRSPGARLQYQFLLLCAVVEHGPTMYCREPACAGIVRGARSCPAAARR